MTNNDELALKLKAAAEIATPGEWERGDGKHGGELLVYCDDALGSAVCEATSTYNSIPKLQRISNLTFIATANPANILALLAERDADKKRIAELETVTAAAEKLVRCKGRYHSEQNYRALAALFGVSTPDLPPLDTEARTVSVNSAVGCDACGGNGSVAIDHGDLGVEHMVCPKCTAAGIKLEVGE